MIISMLSFALFDLVRRDELRIAVSMSSPRRATEVPNDSALRYELDLQMGPENAPRRKVFGLSPIECLALALASVDSLIRLENARAPLAWDDGRAYGGDFDLPVSQIVERLENELSKAHLRAMNQRSSGQ